MDTWFTSDSHFSHKFVASKRGYECVEAMDADIIKTWNSQAKRGDVVYHLGDFAFSRPEAYLEQLNGQVHIIFGNHDSRWRKNLARSAAWSGDVKFIKHPFRAFLSHYAHRVWPESHYSTLHLYGHSHGHLPGHGRSMDVGWDTAQRLYGAEEIVTLLKDRPLPPNHT